MTKQLNALIEILSAGNVATAARVTSRQGKHYECVIGIGNDHCAFLTLDSDALEELERMTGVEFNRGN